MSREATQVLPARKIDELQANGSQNSGEAHCEVPQEITSVLNSLYIRHQDTLEMKEGELTRILGLMNEQSASLILMLLCDNKLDLCQVERESDNGMLESNLKAVRCITGYPSRVDIARASRNFIGSLYSEGQVVSFSHTYLQSTCAFVLYTLNPHFLLQNCSLKFMCERVQHQSAQSKTLNEDHNIIYVSEMYYDIIASRLAEAIKEGHYGLSLSHPILQEETVVDKVLQHLKSNNKSTVENTTSSSVPLCKTDEGKYLLQHAVKAQSIYLVKRLETSAYRFSEREIIKGFHTCICYGSVQLFDHLITQYGSVITLLNRKRGFVAAIDHYRIEVVDLLMQYGADISDLSGDRQRNLFHMAGKQENIMLCEDVLCHALVNSPIKNHVRTLFRSKSGAMFREICNELLQIACIHACMILAEMVVAYSDTNNRGQHGRTPIMNATYRCKNDMLNLLVRNGADLTLTDNFDDTVLHQACHRGNQSFVEHLLPSFDINVPGWNGWTPVMTAANSGQKDVFDMLVTKDADLTQPNIFGSTVFHIACLGGNQSIVEHLLPLFDINIRGENGLTPVMCASTNGNKEVFNQLITKGADLTLSSDDGDTVLHVACQEGHTYIAEFLLPAFDINIRGGNERTPVMDAASRGMKEVFDLLVAKGADLTLSDDGGDTILHLACEGGSSSIVEYLLPTFDIDCRKGNGWTPIMFAANSGHDEIFDLLVRRGADLKRRSHLGSTVFHLACQGGNKSIVERLLPSFDINIRGEDGMTPVMYAASSGAKEVFDLLVAKGAELTVSSDTGSTVFHQACQGGNKSIVERLLPLFDINIRGEDERTPVMYSSDSGTREVFDLLITKGADLMLTDNYDKTLLHIACEGESKSIVNYLLPLFDINCRGLYGRTPVMTAASSGKKDLFELLVTKGADLQLADNDGTIVFHCACEGGNISIVSYTMPLFSVHMRGEVGLTPLMQAVCEGHIDVFDFLMSHHADASLEDDCGDTLLHLACETRHLRMVKHVLPYCDINARNKPGWTAAMVALIYGRTKVFNYLVDEGTDPLLDNVGDDILTLARRGGCAEVIQKYCGMNVKLQLSEKWTELMRFLVYGVFIMGHLKQGSPELEQRDGFGDTLLHLAVRGGNKQCVEHLLPSYDINVRGRYGWTPVMMAARCGHLDVLQCLLSHQADLSLVSDTGEGVYSLARRGGHVNTLNYLLTLPEDD